MTQQAFVERGLIKDLGPDMPSYPAQLLADVPDTAEIGMTWDGETAAWPDPSARVTTTVPTSCSKLGLKRALSETGSQAAFPAPQWDAVKAAVAKDENLQEDWDLAITINRADPLVQAMIAGLKWKDTQVDALLLRAAVLVG